MKKLMAILICASVVGCDSKPAAPAATATTGPGPTKTETPPSTTNNETKAAPDPEIAISGKVSFKGTPPKRAAIKVGADEHCAAAHPDTDPLLKEEVIVGAAGGLQNVIVRVKSGLEGRTFPPPSAAQRLSQKGCRYDPHVFGLVAGQSLCIVNDDGTLHNVHLLPAKNTLNPDNTGQKPGQENSWTIKTSEDPFLIKCDIHPWMGSWCLVSSHPYFAVTKDDGAFELKNLPPGEYGIEAWHEKYGVQTQTVKVGAKEKKTVAFEFQAK